MTDVTTDRKEISPRLEAKQILLQTGLTVTGGTSFVTLNLASVGMKKVLHISAVRHSTDGSVIVSEAVTSAVSDGVLTVTTAAGNNNQRRVVIVTGE